MISVMADMMDTLANIKTDYMSDITDTYTTDTVRMGVQIICLISQWKFILFPHG